MFEERQRQIDLIAYRHYSWWSRKAKQRQIDLLAYRHFSWWKDNYTLIKNTKIKTLHKVFILAFIAGAILMLFWTISDRYFPLR